MTNKELIAETPVQPLHTLLPDEATPMGVSDESDEAEDVLTLGLHDQFEFPESDGHDPYEGCSTWARIMCGRVARSAAPVLTAQQLEAKRMATVEDRFSATPSNLTALGIRLD
jgi:hypothetical protein